MNDTLSVRNTFSVDESIALARLFNDLRNSPPVGVVGLKEFRDLLSRLFPEFDEVRDSELDDFLDEYIRELTTPPAVQLDRHVGSSGHTHNSFGAEQAFSEFDANEAAAQDENFG